MDANGGPSSRAVIGDIEKIKKVATLLEAVGEAVIPVISETIVNSEKAVIPAAIVEPGSAGKVLPRGLQLLHSAISGGPNDAEPNMVTEATKHKGDEELKDGAVVAAAAAASTTEEAATTTAKP